MDWREEMFWCILEERDEEEDEEVEVEVEVEVVFGGGSLVDVGRGFTSLPKKIEQRWVRY